MSRMDSLIVIVCTIFPHAIHCLGDCPQCIPTVSVVPRCPSNEKEWILAAKKKNCSFLDYYRNCSKNDNVVYHCVLNKNATELMEVCAPIWYMSGYCARFSIEDRRLVNDPGLDCTKFVHPCPTRFPSNESFKYQMCYSSVDNKMNVLAALHGKSEGYMYATFVMAAILALFVIFTILLLMFIKRNWRRVQHSGNLRIEQRAEKVDEFDGLLSNNAEHSKAENGKIEPDVNIDSNPPEMPDPEACSQKKKDSEATNQLNTKKDEPEKVIDFTTMSGKSISCPLKNVTSIGDLRNEVSHILSLTMQSVWVVDKENGTTYRDDTTLQPTKKERYTLMLGNMVRTNGTIEDGKVDTDVISNKNIAHGKCQMSCGHFTAPETLFDWVKDKLPGSGDVELQCPKCGGLWEEEELVENCSMSEDEKLFLNRVLEVNAKIKKLKQQTPQRR